MSEVGVAIIIDIKTIKTIHEWNKREYEERVREIEHGSFSPLVFSTAGGMGPIATTVYKRIASLIADKRQEPLFFGCDAN